MSSKIYGFNIPKYLRDGSTFHGSHEAYSNWIKEALIKIDNSGAEGALLKQKMDDMAVFLRSEVTKTYGNGIPKYKTGGSGKSLHEHFQNIDPF
jgi:hypothetical protein